MIPIGSPPCNPKYRHPAPRHCDQEYGSHELDDEWEADDGWRLFYEEEGEPECQCGRKTAGEGCEQCGQPLCPMCFETGAGFCSGHPDRDYHPDVPPGCDGCKWWSQRLAKATGGGLVAWCFNEASPAFNSYQMHGCDQREEGEEVDA